MRYTEQNIRDVWNLSNQGKLRRVIAKELGLEKTEVDYLWNKANSRWGRAPKTHMPKFIIKEREEPKKPFKRPPAVYSNPQWNVEK